VNTEPVPAFPPSISIASYISAGMPEAGEHTIIEGKVFQTSARMTAASQSAAGQPRYGAAIKPVRKQSVDHAVLSLKSTSKARR